VQHEGGSESEPVRRNGNQIDLIVALFADYPIGFGEHLSVKSGVTQGSDTNHRVVMKGTKA
jgi:hypothetical protein